MFLESTPKQLTAIQVNNWINALNAGIDSAKTNYDNITNWLSTVESNEEYSAEDKTEVVAKLIEAVNKIKSLLPSE